MYGYGSIPINTIFRGMNIHLPAILMFTRGTSFWHTAIYIYIRIARNMLVGLSVTDAYRYTHLYPNMAMFQDFFEQWI